MGTNPSVQASPSPTEPATGADVEISAADLQDLEKGDCVTADGPPAKTSCDAPGAVAKVLDIGKDSRPPVDPLASDALVLCPSETDYPVDVDVVGYVCLRNLRGPHPGKPGAGGGVVVFDDCVALDEVGQGTEVPCDGRGDQKPQYKITTIVESILGDSCPRGKGRAAFKMRGDYVNEYCGRRLS